ncbi:MAG: ABC transporter ATP-binding protein [Pseudomonadota bacterium]
MTNIVNVSGVSKIFDGGFHALKGVNLQIREGEVLALLGPNGAGKTTLISTICGLTNLSAGTITVGGHDNVTEFRAARRLIGLVPQEITLEPFEQVQNTVRFSRGMFGYAPNNKYIDEILAKLSLADKKTSQINQLSGGMRRRVLIAKALSHEPRILFLDEPTAGVDVELRKGMWDVIEELKASGVTIILTTHYLEEAEMIADRIAVINKGEILLVEEKDALMKRMGQKDLTVELQTPIKAIPVSLSKYDLELGEGGATLKYTYDTKSERTGITQLLSALSAEGLVLKDLQTHQSSLEDIFVSLVREDVA